MVDTTNGSQVTQPDSVSLLQKEKDGKDADGDTYKLLLKLDEGAAQVLGGNKR